MKSSRFSTSFGLFMLRLFVGGLFAAHGYPKVFGGGETQLPDQVARYLGTDFVQAMQGGPAGFAEALRSMGIPMPAVSARFVGILELAGGLFLIVGLLTRPIALLLAINMAVGIRKAHWPQGLMAAGGMEYPLLLLGACLALTFAGPGKISVWNK
jgi:putative oxidoreductase